jgi:hypothetical protein
MGGPFGGGPAAAEGSPAFSRAGRQLSVAEAEVRQMGGREAAALRRKERGPAAPALTFSATKAKRGWKAVRPVSTSPMNSWRAPAGMDSVRVWGGVLGGGMAGRAARRAAVTVARRGGVLPL